MKLNKQIYSKLKKYDYVHANHLALDRLHLGDTNLRRSLYKYITNQLINSDDLLEHREMAEKIISISDDHLFHFGNAFSYLHKQHDKRNDLCHVILTKIILPIYNNPKLEWYESPDIIMHNGRYKLTICTGLSRKQYKDTLLQILKTETPTCQANLEEKIISSNPTHRTDNNANEQQIYSTYAQPLKHKSYNIRTPNSNLELYSVQAQRCNTKLRSVC